MQLCPAKRRWPLLPQPCDKTRWGKGRLSFPPWAAPNSTRAHYIGMQGLMLLQFLTV